MVRRTIYCVQPYERRGGRIEMGALLHYPCATEAEERGRRLRRFAEGVVVYLVSGYPEGDAWDEPELLAVHGTVPGLRA